MIIDAVDAVDAVREQSDCVPVQKAEPGDPLFELEGVSFSYQGQPALRDVSFTIRSGERLALLGANGSGKSTLLKLLDGLYHPDTGSLRAFGHPLTQRALQEEEFALSFRRRVGLVFQDPDTQLFSPTVWDEVVFAPLHLGLPREEVTARAEEAMALLGIGELRDRVPHRLSGGEKKKVALASVLSLRPDVWLLDEPTASLDPRSEGRLLDFLCELSAQGKTVVTATHQLDYVEELSDRAIVFDEQHRIAADGPTGEILAQRDLLVACNLLHEHKHRHGETEHAHIHRHTHQHGH